MSWYMLVNIHSLKQFILHFALLHNNPKPSNILSLKYTWLSFLKILLNPPLTCTLKGNFFHLTVNVFVELHNSDNLSSTQNKL